MIVLEEFHTKTGGRLDALDITEDVRAVVEATGIEAGAALVFSPHTTCSVAVTNGSPDLVSDIRARMSALAPAGDYYRHDDLTLRTENLVEDEPANAPAHIFHVFEGSASARVAVVKGELALARSERILFVELDSSRPRRYCVQVIGE